MKKQTNLFGTLLFYEIKKIVMNRFTIAVLIILTGYSLFQGVFQAKQTGDYEKRAKELRQTIDGRMIDDELLSEMVAVTDEYGVAWNETNCAYEGLAEWVLDVTGGRPLSTYDAEGVYQARIDTINETFEMSELSDSEREYWEKAGVGVKEPFIWHDIYETRGIIEIVGSTPIAMLFIIALFISQIFAGEVTGRTDPLIRSSRGGLRTTFLAKISAAIICMVALTFYSLLVAVGTSIILWGTNGWDTAVQIYLPFAAVNMTVGEHIVRLIVIAFASTVLLTAVTCFLSEYSKNPIVAMAALFGGFLAILVGARQIPFSFRLLSQTLYLLSPVDMDSGRVQYEFRLIGWDGHYLTAYQFAPILYIVLSVILIIITRQMYLKRDRI